MNTERTQLHNNNNEIIMKPEHTLQISACKSKSSQQSYQTIPDCIRYIIGVFCYNLNHRQTFLLHIYTLACVKAGEVLVFCLPSCLFYYLAKLIIFIRSSRISCIFFKVGFKGIYLRERNFTQIFEGSAPTFHGEALGIR